MFGVGMQEIFLICVIALIVVGPKKLPEIATALGRAYAEFRRTFDDMKRNVETELRSEELRRTLMDVPPPPGPPTAAAGPESPLTTPPAAPSPYPEVMDAAPPPPGAFIPPGAAVPTAPAPPATDKEPPGGRG